MRQRRDPCDGRLRGVFGVLETVGWIIDGAQEDGFARLDIFRVSSRDKIPARDDSRRRQSSHRLGR